MIRFNDTTVSFVERRERAFEWKFLRTRALGFYCVRLVGVKAALDDASDAIYYFALLELSEP